jgi:hypothetical protein
MFPILRRVETPEFFDVESPRQQGGAPERNERPPAGGIWAAGDRITWVSALVLCVSAFTDWYAGSGVGVKLAVIGWHTGVLGKLVFFIGFALIVLSVMAELGMELPAAVPESLVVIALGALATIFVLIRLISIPEDLLPADGRGIGLYISLVAALAAIAAGIVRASEEL